MAWGGESASGEHDLDADMDEPGEDGATTPLDCSRIGAAPASCLGATLATRVCETWGPLLEPRVAEAWLRCLSGDTSTSLQTTCDTSRIMACGLEAIAGLPTDGTHASVCAGVAEECSALAPELTSRVCELTIAAFRLPARPMITECLQHGCQTGAFGSCIP